MQPKKWLFNIILFSGILYSFVLIVNIIIDPYGIFKSNIFYLDKGFNERFLKIDLLQKDKKLYNSYIFGSSRVGSTFPSTVEQYIPGSNFYNFSVIYGNIVDVNKILTYLVNNDFSVKNIYFQIDMNAMSTKIPEDAYYENQHHPYVENTNKILFYLKHLIIFPWGKMIRKVKNHYAEEKSGFYDLKTGVMYRLKLDKKISENHELYVKNEPSFHRYNDRVNKIEPDDYTIVMKNFKHIVRLCNENEINLIIYTTPLNHKTMDKFDINSTFRFINDITKIHDLWYFSGYNSITLNDYNYYEDSHYLYNISKLIAAKIFNDKTVKVPNDFGLLLTKKNIKKYEIKLKENMFQHDKK